MKKLFLILAVVAFVCTGTSAHATMFISLNPQATGIGVGTGQTGAFDVLAVDANTTSQLLNLSGDFKDVGNIRVTGLSNTVSSLLPLAGYGETWSLVGGWALLEGNATIVTDEHTHFDYDAGALLKLYVTTKGTGYGATTGALDDINLPNSLIPGFVGTEVASLRLVSGFGDMTFADGLATHGVTTMYWEFVSLYDGGGANGDFWLDEFGVPLDLNDLNDPNSANPILLALSHMTSSGIVIDEELGTTLSFHSGDITFSPVPEPASMLLFGSGLFGLIGAGIKKRKIS
ncbi:MAG: PEP-CTERM sorting domain-containing protein [Candidatus Omnitrophica bacterium]|nr:PEP-CTERM sorting domain-containing protein [Candidatus Omnitrophota bacterium]MBU1995988.1 PEP-CTERM sorting domain-containing protein [Candidatus Omnitrophota bacterium]